MWIIGCDWHTRCQQIAAMDTTTGELVERRVEHQGGQVEQFYTALPGPGIEAGVPPERPASTQAHGHSRKIGSETDFFNISKGVGRVKSCFVLVFCFVSSTPLHLRSHAPLLGGSFAANRGSFSSLSNLALGPF